MGYRRGSAEALPPVPPPDFDEDAFRVRSLSLHPLQNRCFEGRMDSNIVRYATYTPHARFTRATYTCHPHTLPTCATYTRYLRTPLAHHLHVLPTHHATYTHHLQIMPHTSATSTCYLQVLSTHATYARYLHMLPTYATCTRHLHMHLLVLPIHIPPPLAAYTYHLHMISTHPAYTCYLHTTYRYADLARGGAINRGRVGNIIVPDGNSTMHFSSGMPVFDPQRCSPRRKERTLNTLHHARQLHQHGGRGSCGKDFVGFAACDLSTGTLTLHHTQTERCVGLV